MGGCFGAVVSEVKVSVTFGRLVYLLAVGVRNGGGQILTLVVFLWYMNPSDESSWSSSPRPWP